MALRYGPRVLIGECVEVDVLGLADDISLWAPAVAGEFLEESLIPTLAGGAGEFSHDAQARALNV